MSYQNRPWLLTWGDEELVRKVQTEAQSSSRKTIFKNQVIHDICWIELCDLVFPCQKWV